jgi:hypothetical protein
MNASPSGQRLCKIYDRGRNANMVKIGTPRINQPTLSATAAPSTENYGHAPARAIFEFRALALLCRALVKKLC